MHDPNFPPNLSIQPSASAIHASENGLIFDQESDIKRYGIAGRVWEAAYALAAYTIPPTSVIDQQTDAEQLSGLNFDPQCSLFYETQARPITVVEVGSGTGYAGIHIAHQLDILRRRKRTCSAPINVILTDLENVVPLLQQGIREHEDVMSSGVRLEARALEWGNLEHLLALAEYLNDLGTPVTHILCSDLVYFPHLYPQLLRTLLALTSPPFCDISFSPEIIIGCKSDKYSIRVVTLLHVVIDKVRSLTKETPFWQVFGTWFTFAPVLAIETGPGEVEAGWSRFGHATDTHIFVATRRSQSFQWDIPNEDSQLMNGFGPNPSRLDDTFESLLLLGIDADE
ncbi:hypothetical protein FRC12_005978 [Ceratobasidium sp. 428]|nr:hypothetical protein FRC12_005978 [Ceratobasidium sp. 428]